MADSSTLTYEQDPPRRPTLDDLDGGQCVNDAEYPPVPGIDPAADAMNQRDKLIVALAALVGVAWVHVTFSGGTPSIAAVGGCRQGGVALVAGDFALTDHGPGDTSVLHAGGKLPPKTWPPLAHLVGSAAGEVAVESVTTGARVRTKVSAAAADANFLLFFSGL